MLSMFKQNPGYYLTENFHNKTKITIKYCTFDDPKSIQVIPN